MLQEAYLYKFIPTWCSEDKGKKFIVTSKYNVFNKVTLVGIYV